MSQLRNNIRCFWNSIASLTNLRAGDIGYIHPDGSLHVVLAHADAAQAVEHHRGELHPLACLARMFCSIRRATRTTAVAERLLDTAAANITANASGRTPSGENR